MLKCEGYKMFFGTMQITPKTSDIIKPFKLEGTWFYKPEYKCWYCKGFSYVEDICTIVEDKTQEN